MPWSRVDKDELLITAPTRQQVTSEARMLEDRFQRRGLIGWSDVTQEFYQWMARRKPAPLAQNGKRGRPKIYVDLHRASELRAQGLSWAKVASEIGVSFGA